MKIMKPGFQLEKTGPGTFLVQGFAGGVVATFLMTTFFVAWETDSSRGSFSWVLPFSLLLGGFLGMALSTFPWYLSGDDGYEMHPVHRVWTVLAGLIVFAFLLSFALGSMTSFWYWLGVLLLAVSTGIFAGSNIRPWLIFTSGSIALPEPRLILRLSSNPSVSGPQAITLHRFNFVRRVKIRSATQWFFSLPLRFVSLLCLTIWLQSVAFYWRVSLDPVRQFLLWDLLPVVYFSLTVYVSLRSPRKSVLLLIGAVANTGPGLVAFAGYRNPFGPAGGSFPTGDIWPLVLAVVSSVFLLLWFLFLAARLTVTVNATESMAAVPHIPEFDRETMCLGSRFVDWEAGVQRV
ncbi:MAG TPA: hypothetical protein VKB46_27310 [Pyrinomonadaceae bacterium]|nr:hypothetical protein [Pyrinomonadaceae bacterium]